MILNGMTTMKIANDFGYFDTDYDITKDTTLTFQEYLLIDFLHSGAWELEAFNPDELFNDNTIFDAKKHYIDNWYKYYEASKNHPCIIDTPWDKVLKNKRN